MSVKHNAPYYILSAVKRFYDELPQFLGETKWEEIEPKLIGYLSELEEQTNAYVPSTQIVKLLSQSEDARQRLSMEILVQRAIALNIQRDLNSLAKVLEVDEQSVDWLTAKAMETLHWDVMLKTLSSENEPTTRVVKIQQDAIGGAQVVRFNFLRMDTIALAVLIGSLTKEVDDIANASHPVLVAAAILAIGKLLHEATKHTIDLGEQEASVFWGFIMVASHKSPKHANKEQIKHETNIRRKKIGRQALTQADFDGSLLILEKVGVITQTEYGDDMWLITEDFQINPL